MIDAVATTTRVARDVNGAILAYIRLTKPRIVGLLVVTTIPAMMLAEQGYAFALADPRDGRWAARSSPAGRTR